MTTAEVAKRLIELYNQNESLKAEEELYAQDVVSYEQAEDMPATHGLSAVMDKTRKFPEMVEKLEKAHAEMAFVNNDSFLVIFDMDALFKNGYHMVGKEYGFYKVKDGKIIEEYFYAAPLA